MENKESVPNLPEQESHTEKGSIDIESLIEKIYNDTGLIRHDIDATQDGIIKEQILAPKINELINSETPEMETEKRRALKIKIFQLLGIRTYGVHFKPNW